MTYRSALIVLAFAAIDAPLDPRAIEEALAIANSSLEATHRRYHADYRFAVNTPPVDFVSIVSPFRRLVLAAETEKRLGRRMFGQREALAALQPDPDRIEVYVELTFHPLNTFVGVPAYTVELEPASARALAIVPQEIDRLPRFGPRVDHGWYPFPYPYPVGPKVPASASQPLAGGTLIARLAGKQLDENGAYAVVVRDGPKELGRVRVDLERLR